MVTILRAAARRPQPWANGRGTTSEVISWPPGSNLATCAWRVSVADLDVTSAFSALPGLDRTLVALAGDGIGLVVDGEPVLLAEFESIRFSGESVVSGGPLGAATHDLNVMVRRGVGEAKITVSRHAGVHRMHPERGEQLLAFVAQGDAAIAAGGAALLPGDAVLVGASAGVTLRCSGILILISVRLRA